MPPQSSIQTTPSPNSKDTTTHGKNSKKNSAAKSRRILTNPNEIRREAPSPGAPFNFQIRKISWRGKDVRLIFPRRHRCVEMSISRLGQAVRTRIMPRSIRRVGGAARIGGSDGAFDAMTNRGRPGGQAGCDLGRPAGGDELRPPERDREPAIVVGMSGRIGHLACAVAAASDSHNRDYDKSSLAVFRDSCGCCVAPSSPTTTACASMSCCGCEATAIFSHSGASTEWTCRCSTSCFWCTCT